MALFPSRTFPGPCKQNPLDVFSAGLLINYWVRNTHVKSLSVHESQSQLSLICDSVVEHVSKNETDRGVIPSAGIPVS